jgi:alkyl hydroperoxide reductase subunit AhpF
MGLLNVQNEHEVRKAFQSLRDPVKMVVFSSSFVAGDLCTQNEQLVREVAGLSDKISVEVLTLAVDRERAEQYRVDQVPSIVVEGVRDYGIRFYGVPLGYEFKNLIDAITVASTGEPALAAETRASLARLDADVDIKVFSTPT